MRIVLDTNVLVSGLLTPFGPPGGIVRLVSDGRLVLCYDARILAEYREVLLRPRFLFDPEQIAVLLDYIQNTGLVHVTRPLARPLPDPDDQPFLEVATAARACLVTGNKAHFPKSLCKGISVFGPADFLQHYLEADAGADSMK